MKQNVKEHTGDSLDNEKKCFGSCKEYSSYLRPNVIFIYCNLYLPNIDTI
jgi:hypothetical protein